MNPRPGNQSTQSRPDGRTQEGTTMIKKIMLLASALAALVAFAVPAVASAGQWTDNGTILTEGQKITQSYEGFLQFNTGPTGTFGCDVTITIETNGPTAGQVTAFNPTTATCIGTIAFKGCKLIGHTSNKSFNINNTGNPLKITKGAENITIRNEYEAGSCAGKQTTSHLEFANINATYEANAGTTLIEKLTISGSSTAGVPAEGSLTPEAPLTLGIK
jgi:hypothetical protein